MRVQPRRPQPLALPSIFAHSVHRLKTNRHLDPAPLTQPQGSSSTSRSGRPDGISTHLACSSTKRRATCWGSPETPVLICAPLWVPWSLFGAPPEQYWPYEIVSFDVEPTAFCYAFAANFQAIKYFRLDPSPLTGAQVLQNIKNYLGAGFPSMFGFPVYDEYMHIPANGQVAFPAPNSRLYGGHANVAVGYDDNLTINSDKGALLVRNSWGTGWGLNGYAWLAYRYVTEGLAVDWWSVVKDEWVDTGKF